MTRAELSKALEYYINSTSGIIVTNVFKGTLIQALKLLNEQQKITRCKDCKHLIRHSGFMDDGYCRYMLEKHKVKFKPGKDWFCACGERKGSGQNG